MTTRPIALIPAACISLLLMLAPGAALSQNQKEPSEQQPGKTVAEPLQPQPELSSTPSETAERAQLLQKTEPNKEEPVTSANEKSVEYIIKQGDTLWDISNAFLKDPFLWPFIWKANPAISNPDLIYAGNKLIIPSLTPIEQAMRATPTEEETKQLERRKATEISKAPETGSLEGLGRPKLAKPEEKPSGGSELILPEERPTPVIDKYAMLSAGFVNGVEENNIIVGDPGDLKTSYAYDDIVFIKFTSPGNVNVGDKFLIYTPLESIKHPRTGKIYGRLIRGLGILQITAKDPAADVVTARITLSFDAIERNSLVTPYEEPVLIYPPSDKKVKDISGYILAITERRTMAGQMDFVYLDKGSADGVDPGDNFFVYYAEPAKKGWPRTRIGDVQVILVKEHSSTAVVRESIYPMTRGNIVDFKK